MATIKTIAKYLCDHVCPGVNPSVVADALKTIKKIHGNRKNCTKKIDTRLPISNNCDEIPKTPGKLSKRIIKFDIDGIMSIKTKKYGIIHFHNNTKIAFNRNPFYAYGYFNEENNNIYPLTKENEKWLIRMKINVKDYLIHFDQENSIEENFDSN